MDSTIESALQASKYGLFVNLFLALGKIAAGIVGNAYALVADGIESSADVFSSFIVWDGLRIALKPADADHPYDLLRTYHDPCRQSFLCGSAKISQERRVVSHAGF